MWEAAEEAGWVGEAVLPATPALQGSVFTIQRSELDDFLAVRQSHHTLFSYLGAAEAEVWETHRGAPGL